MTPFFIAAGDAADLLVSFGLKPSFDFAAIPELSHVIIIATPTVSICESIVPRIPSSCRVKIVDLKMDDTLTSFQSRCKQTPEYKPDVAKARRLSIMMNAEEMLLEGTSRIDVETFLVNAGYDAAEVSSCVGDVVDNLTAHPEEGAVLDAPQPAESFYYERFRKEYLLRNKRGCWLSLAEGQFKKELQARGLDPARGKQERLSQVDAKLIYLRGFHDVDYAGSLAGHDEGFYETNGQRVLVTDSPLILKPVPGEWPTLKTFIGNLLIDGENDQVSYLMGWLKVAYASLAARSRRPGQALVLCGPRNCGKSLLQQLITVILGGRMAKPYDFMTDSTSFNSELFQAEHLCIEDEAATTDIRSRRAFGAQIKQITACDSQRCHAKGKQALTLSPFWRLTISLNDETENLMVLPPVDESIEDKLILFKTCSSAMPMSTAAGAARAAFWKRLTSEIPAFLAYLDSWVIEPELVSERYGISHFHHPRLLRELESLSPEFRLQILVDMVLFSGELILPWSGSAQDLEVKLCADGPHQYDARRLLSWNTACGTYLARLNRKHPDRFKHIHTESGNHWEILPPTDNTPEITS